MSIRQVLLRHTAAAQRGAQIKLPTQLKVSIGCGPVRGPHLDLARALPRSPHDRRDLRVPPGLGEGEYRRTLAAIGPSDRPSASRCELPRTASRKPPCRQLLPHTSYAVHRDRWPAPPSCFTASSASTSAPAVWTVDLTPHRVWRGPLLLSFAHRRFTRARNPPRRHPALLRRFARTKAPEEMTARGTRAPASSASARSRARSTRKEKPRR